MLQHDQHEEDCVYIVLYVYMALTVTTQHVHTKLTLNMFIQFRERKVKLNRNEKLIWNFQCFLTFCSPNKKLIH